MSGIFALAAVAAFTTPVAKTDPAVAVPFDSSTGKLLVSEGQIVSKGQVVAVSDQSGLLADVTKSEAELNQVREQTQSLIVPVLSPIDIAGGLPRTLPAPELPPTPTPPSDEAKNQEAQKRHQEALATALHNQDMQREALKDASENLAASDAALADAEQDLQATSAKLPAAQIAADRAAAKAANAKYLFEQGAISVKELTDVSAESQVAAKELADLKSQILADQKSAADSTARVKSAKDASAKAEAALQSSTDLAEKIEAAPVPHSAAISEPPRRLVRRHIVPAGTTLSQAPAVPVILKLDSHAMDVSQSRIKDLTERIAALKKQIQACKIEAPVAGRIHLMGRDGFEIELPVE